MTAPYIQLANRGPLTMAELEQSDLNPTQRQTGIRKFRPKSQSQGGNNSRSGRTVPVYYLHKKHQPKTVIKKWLDVNEEALEGISNRQLHYRICEFGQDWKEASRDVLDNLAPHDGSVDVNPDPGGTCPMCNAEYDGYLPNHLPCDG